jgi:GWxTD domain-containing protein
MRKLLHVGLVLGLVFLVFISCRFSRVVRDLSPEHKEFLSEVRYIITKKERKVFLDLPSPEKEKFIEQFWKKRDPDPVTEINEFKEDYYERIKKANHLFREGGTPGWLQDRGRIYILLGPPGSRDKYPTGYRFYDRPSEAWYYGFFPIIFVDYSYTGNYELLPISAQYVARLLKAQIDLKPEVQIEGETLGFNLNIEKIADDQVKVMIEIPYKNIWLIEKGSKLETTLVLSLDVFSDSKKKVWDFKEEYSISIDQDEIMETLSKNYVIPVEISLSQGEYKMSVLLENKTDGKKVTKTLKFNL